MAANFPDSPSINDTFTDNGLTFVWNGEAWKLNSSSGTKGEKGQKGEVGATGDKGQKGQKGEVGDKGQKGEIGPAGGSGGQGNKGDKGDTGQKGQTGADNSTKGQKGQKGEQGTSIKGEPGADNSTKGQKGEVGADNSTKGQKGEQGIQGNPGADNSTKGQKGEVGAQGNQGTPAISNSNDSVYRNLVFIDGSSATTLKTNDSNRLQVRASDGALKVNGDVIAFASSDINLKENITPIPNALDKIVAISGNTFTWKSGSYNEALNDDTGVIAQEVEALSLPGITTTRSDGTKAVRYERLVPVLIEAIKELKKEIDEIKNAE